MDYTITIKTRRTGGPEYEDDDYPHTADIINPYILDCQPHLPGELSQTRLKLSNFDSFLTQLVGNLNLIKKEGGNACVNWNGKTYSFKDFNPVKKETREAQLERVLSEYFQPKNSHLLI